MSDNFFKTPLGIIFTLLALVGAIALFGNPGAIYAIMAVIHWIVFIILGIVAIIFLLKRM